MRFVFVLLTLSFLVTTVLSGQAVDVSKWELRMEKIDPTTYDVIAEVAIDPGWYVYSRFLAADEGPIPTSFVFKDGARITSQKEGGNKHEAFDPIFEMHVVKFSERATFTTRVKVAAGSKQLKGSYTFMACDDSKCLPPIEQPFTLDIP